MRLNQAESRYSVATSENDSYTLNLHALRFRDDSVEAAYREETLYRTRWFCRGAWVLIPILGGSFGLMDHLMFGDKASLVLMIRAAVVLISLVVLGISFVPRSRSYFVASSAFYIVLIGTFCTFLVAMDDRSTVSPYFLGMFMAYAAIYTTVGVGFRNSFIALVLTALGFLVTVGLLAPVATKVLITYVAFLPTVVVVYAYSAYLVERVSRERYATTARLKQTLEEVKTLSGMLPICASCKKVRDDQGYWNQIESYVSEHSEAVFSHGLCPGCAEELFPDFVDHEDDGDS